MKFRNAMLYSLCMVLCLSQIMVPFQTALSESSTIVYEDGYAVRLNADGTRTITLGTTMEGISSQSEDADESDTDKSDATEVETTVHGSGDNILVTIESDEITIEFSPEISENDPPAIADVNETIAVQDAGVRETEYEIAHDTSVEDLSVQATSLRTFVHQEQSDTWSENIQPTSNMNRQNRVTINRENARIMEEVPRLLGVAVPLNRGISEGGQLVEQFSEVNTISTEKVTQTPTHVPTVTPKEEPTPSQEPTMEPNVASTPAFSPENTVIPTNTASPDEMNVPDKTAAPENTELPAESDRDDNTPTQTALPEATDGPVEMPDPAPTKSFEPASSELPEVSEEPNESLQVVETPIPGNDRNTQIRYTKLENGIKEEVVINSYRGGHAISYTFRLTGIIPVQMGSAFALVNEEGQTVGNISAPYMFDAVGERTTDISVSMQSLGNGCYRLSYTPSDSWLADSSRAYPVVIDPTVTIQGARQGEDNYVTDGDKSDKNYAYDADYLYVGNHAGYNYVSYIRPVIPNSLKKKAGRIIIKNVTMTMYASNVTGSQIYSLHLVTGGSWSSRAITHANSPAYSSEAYQQGGIYSGKNVWNVKNVFSEWFNALAQKENCGFVLKGDGTEEAWLRIKSADYGTAATGKERIKFEVTYEEVGGELGLAAFAHGNGANSGTGYVNLSWNAISNAEGYYIGIYNGKDYEYFYVGNVTSFSTKGKGIWPTQSEIESGRFALHGDGMGGDLPAIPAFTYRNVEGGKHSTDINYYFRVVPANEFGQAVNPDLYPGVSAILPDTIAPNMPSAVSIDPSSYTNLNRATVFWSGIMDYNGNATLSSSLGENGRVQYALDSTDEWRDTDVNTATGSFVLDITACTDGQHTVYIRGVDASGNTGAYRGVYFYIDRTGPIFAQVSVLPDSWSRNDDILLIWSGLSERGQVSKIETSIDGGAWIDIKTISSESSGYTIDVSALADGKHTLSIRATDELGNVGTTVTNTFNIDRTAPEIALLDIDPSGWTNASEISINWSGTLDAASGIATLDYRIDGGAWTQISSITEEGSVTVSTTGILDGVHTVDLRASDYAGNTCKQSTSFYMDKQLPIAILTAPSNGALLNGVVEIRGTAYDSHLSGWTLTATGITGVPIEIAKGSEIVDDSILGTLDLSAFSNGENVKLLLNVEDAAGNIAQETVMIVCFTNLDTSFESDVTMHLPAVITKAQDEGSYMLPEGITEKETYLYVDGVYAETVIDGKFLIDAAKYSENSTHTVSVIAKDSFGALHYGDSFGAVSLVNRIYEDGASTIDGVIDLPGLSAPKPILVLRLNATDYAPSGTSIRYEYTTGGAWRAILPGQDVRLDEPAAEVSLRAVLAGNDAVQPFIYQIQLYGIVEVAPHSFRARLLDTVEQFEITLPDTLRHALTPFTTTLPIDTQACYYANGVAFGAEALLDARIAEEGSHVSVSGVGYHDDTLYVSGGSMMQLLREDVDGATGTVERDGISCAGVVAVRLKAATRGGEGNYYLSENQKDWITLPNDQYILLHEATDVLYLRAELPVGVRLVGWHMEGASAAPVTSLVELVQAPDQLTVLDYGKFNSKRFELMWSDYNADDPTAPYTICYAVYRNGEQISVTNSHSYVDWNYVPGANYTVSVIREYSDPMDDTQRVLVRESTAISGTRIVMEPPKEHDETSADLSIPEQEPLLSSLYGGDTTFSTGEEVPAANVEINEKLLGKSDYCSLGFEPVNFNTGNFFLETIDVQLSDIGEAQLSLMRTYNTQSSTTDGVFGEKWATEYSMYLQIFDDGTIGIREAGGARHLFTLSGQGYVADAGVPYVLNRQENGYKMDAGNGKTYYFNAVGLLEGIEQKGLRTSILRDENTSVMTAVVLPSGQRVDFESDALGHITRVFLPDGSTLRYEYEGNRLTAFINVSGTMTRYVYDELGRMIEWYDAAGNRQVYNEYDDHSRVVYQIDANGGEYELEYFEDHTVVTDATSSSSEIWFDAQMRTVCEIDSNGAETHFVYNAQGYIATQIDALGRVTTYEYDEHGNKTRTIAPDGATSIFDYDTHKRLIAQTDPNGNQTEYVYNETGNLIQTVFANGSIERREYDAEGNLVSFIDAMGNATFYEYKGTNLTQMTDPLGHVTQYEYDDLNRMTAIVNALGERTEYAYDVSGNVVKITFASGAVFSYTYDALGNCLTQVDALGNTIAYEYDVSGNITAIVAADGNRTEMAYTANGQIAQIMNSLGNTTIYAYDSNGNKVSDTDALGNTTYYEYDELNRLIRKITPSGAELTYEYDMVTGLVTATTDETGVCNVFEYDAVGNLTARVFANGGRIENSYDVMNQLVRQTDPSGDITEFTYDSLGRLSSVTDALGGTTTYAYDAIGNLTKVTDALNNSTQYEYDALGRRVAVVEANGARTEYAYDSAGNLASIKDALGNVTEYRYDLNGTMISTADALGGVSSASVNDVGLVLTATQKNGGQVHYDYDTLGQMIKQTDALGGELSYAYDALGNMIETTDAIGQTARFTYDVMGNITEIYWPDGAKASYVYDKGGRLTTELNETGAKTQYVYDEMNNIASILLNDATTNYTYDVEGNVTKLTDAEGNSTIFEYDALGRMTATVYADGSRDAYTYDALGQLTSKSTREGETIAYTYDEVGNLISMETFGSVALFEYDLLGRLIKKTTTDGSTSYEYDAMGNLTLEIDALGNATKYEYDISGQLTAMVYANGARTEVAYDLNGNVVTETDALGSETCYIYDKSGRVTDVIDALGNTTCYKYDARDNIVRVIDALGHETSFEYDAVGNLTAETDALGYTTCYNYTPEGWLMSVKKPDGGAISYTYNRIGQLLREEYSDERVVSYEYNEFGRLTVTEGKEGRTEYQYNEHNLLSSISYPTGDVIEYSYDSRGNRIGMTYPDGNAVSYVYDEMDRMTDAIGLDGEITHYDYDALGRRIETVSRNIKTAYQYDEVGNIVRQTTTGDSNVDLAYIYDLNGSLIQEQRSENGANITNAYTYDALGRISTFSINGDSREQYSYDAVGNMMEKWVDGTQILMDYNEANQLVSMTSSFGTIRYGYDTNGNLTKKVLDDTYRDSYIYDVSGNLTQYVGYDGYVVDYTYSALDLMAEKTAHGNTNRNTFEEIVSGHGSLSDGGESNAVTTRYTYDILQTYANVLTETVDGETTVYEYGLERIAAYMETNAENVKMQYVYDVRGSVIQTLISSVVSHIEEVTAVPATVAPAVTVRSYAYTPFGELLLEEGEFKTNGYAFNGEFYDMSTGMLNLRARQYEPAMMRFSQRDIVYGYAMNPQTLNRYTYCANNPILFGDPSGMSLRQVIGGIAGGISGLFAGARTGAASAKSTGSNALVGGIKGGLAGMVSGAKGGYRAASGSNTDKAAWDRGKTAGKAAGALAGIQAGISLAKNRGDKLTKEQKEALNKWQDLLKQAQEAKDPYTLISILRRIDLACSVVLGKDYSEPLETYPITLYMGNIWNFNLEEDMLYGEMSVEELLRMGVTQQFLDQGESGILDAFYGLINSFPGLAHGAMYDVLKDMMDHFSDGTGTDYSNDVLTSQVENHKVTQSFMADFLSVFAEELKKKNGDMNGLTYDHDRREYLDIVNGLKNNGVILSQYAYGGGALDLDTYRGLTLAIHGWTEVDVEVVDFKVVDGKYTGKLKYTFRDNFGLDADDWKEFSKIPGFNAWYVLQHSEEFSGKYKPFHTVVDIYQDFSIPAE